MDKNSTQAVINYKERSEALEQQWQELCDRYLPVVVKDSIWRYHRVYGPQEPEQGWKLHISATVLNACKVLEKVAPLLAARSVQFKAPCSTSELVKINSGLYYGYSQVGKVITVYPRTPEEAVSLARQLHTLTRRMAAPSVPFDQRFSEASNIYYRFGAFQQLEIEHANGQRTLAIRNPQGELVPDVRESEHARPDWVTDPFDGLRPRTARRKVLSAQSKNFRVFRALVQRGKGGVYQAVDLSVAPPRPCLLKEGRKNGEPTLDGRDGSWRVRNEENVLSQLAASGLGVPRVYSSFELEGNYYLATEFIEGECLQNLLSRLKRRISVPGVLHYGIQLSTIFAQMHAAGWVWRDCKPTNVIVTPEGDLRPLDFEGACRVERPNQMLWLTPGFTPPEWRELNLRTGLPHDLYALGAMIYLLLTGQMPEATDPLPIEKLRRRVPSEVRRLVMRLLSTNPRRRPLAETVARRLKAALSCYSHRQVNSSPTSFRPIKRQAMLSRSGERRGEQRPHRTHAVNIRAAATGG